MTCGVYEFWCGPYFYQGSSKDMEWRLRQHRNELQAGRKAKKNRKMQAAFDKYGMQDERFLVVCAENLRTVYEQDYLDVNFGTPFCLNRSPSTEGGVKEHTVESRAKMSASQKGKKASEVTRIKMSVAHTGKAKGPTSEETKAKIGAVKKGRPWSEARRAAHEAKKATISPAWRAP